MELLFNHSESFATCIVNFLNKLEGIVINPTFYERVAKFFAKF